LQSRYYNPETGRFLNADAFTSTGQGILGNNMFAYCNNNPVILSDSTGNRPFSELERFGEVSLPVPHKRNSNATPVSEPSSSSTSFAVMLGVNMNVFGYGLQATLNFVSTKENFGLQYSYYYSEDSELSKKNNSMIGIDIGPYSGVQITEKRSMEELTGLAKATGGDLVNGLDILTDENGQYIGWQLGSSLKSVNMHSLYTNTQTIISIPTIDLPEILVDWVMGE